MNLTLQNLFYRVKIISRKNKKDRWDQLLEQTIQQHNEDEGFSKNDDFAFFDDGDDKVFMDDEKLVVIREKKDSVCDDDALKQIFEKEFSPHDGPSKIIQKPPRKSLEYRKSSERSSYSSHSSVHFNE